MKIKKSKIYPYPILFTGSGDYKDSTFSAEKNMRDDFETTEFTISVEIHDKAILQLLQDNDVSLYCHIECSSTKNREIFKIPVEQMKSYIISMPSSFFANNVEVVCLLVANKFIPDFKDGNLIDLYRDEIVSFYENTIIGYTDTDIFELIKKTDINGEVPSIFIVTASEQNDKINYDASADQIRIFLPANEYEIYESYKGTSVRLKQMMIIMPVLIEIFDEIKNDADYQDNAWRVVLDNALEKKGLPATTNDEFKNYSSIEMAQKILGNLVQDAFSEFDKLNERGD